MEEGILSENSYPKIKQSLAWAALHDTFPALLLDRRGFIRAANLLAFWLCDLLRPEEPFRPEGLLGVSIFQLQADQIERVPVELNLEFYSKRSALVKRMASNLHLPHYESFIAAMQADAGRAQIYARAASPVDHEWEYTITVAAPGSMGLYLEFQATNFRLEGDGGFLVMWSPSVQTQSIIADQYDKLSRSREQYVYLLPAAAADDAADTQQKISPLNVRNVERVYYPMLIQDPLWYIVDENKAQRLLVGQSMIGVHFFEMYLSPQLREWMGPLHETAAPRALRYFDVFTSKFLRKEHTLNAAYEQVMQRLAQVPDFLPLLEMARALNIHLNMPDDVDVPFYSCRVLMPCPLTPHIMLQFRSMVRFLHSGLLVNPADRYYQVTLVPENYPTEVALILLYLLSPERVQDESDRAELQQMLWGLAILQTLREGLSKKDGEAANWDPQAACARMSDELRLVYAARSTGATREVSERLRLGLALMDEPGTMEKELLLALLQCWAKGRELDLLAAFCSRELKRHEAGGAQAGELWRNG
jgi:hypothetical protein